MATLCPGSPSGLADFSTGVMGIFAPALTDIGDRSARPPKNMCRQRHIRGYTCPCLQSHVNGSLSHPWMTAGTRNCLRFLLRRQGYALLAEEGCADPYHLWIQPGDGFTFNLLQHGLQRDGQPVWPMRSHRFHNVRDGQDPGFGQNRIPLEAPWIA